MPNEARITDGQGDYSGGVDSGSVPTMQNDINRFGLKPNQISWSVNASVRGGGIGCRTGWRKLALDFSALEDEGVAFKSGLYQGAFMYDPTSGNPYAIASISGRYYQIRLDTNNAVTDITIPGDANSATIRDAWFVQGEEYMVGQNGVAAALIWDGTTLRRAVGTEVPIGRAMDYYMGRLWVQIANHQYVGGDIVGGPTGTVGNGWRDSILQFTESAVFASPNMQAFSIPTNSGAITAISHTALMDTALGEGELFVFTRNSVYATRVPITRNDWNNTAEPLQRVMQRKFGAASDRCVVPVNGDLFYRSPDGIRSLFMALRDFQMWANVPVSRNVNRITNQEDRSQMDFASAINFDNRLWQTCLPSETSQGTVYNGMLVLDFDVISSLQEKYPPAWEGMMNGLQVFQLLEADYGGRQRAFAFALSANNEIEIWELTVTDRFDDVDNRIEWYFESPAFIWGNPFQFKELDSLEIYVDKLFGLVDFDVWYRPDQHACWVPWHSWQDCAIRNPCEDPDIPDCYSMQSYREQYRAPYVLPKPPNQCDGNNVAPYKYGYQFQVMVKVTGWCRIRGMMIHAFPRERAPYESLTC